MKRSILIVHDETVAGRELERRIAGLGYEVVGIAGSVDDAIAMATERSPDVALVDWAAETGVTGADVADEIMRRTRVSAVLVIPEASGPVPGRPGSFDGRVCVEKPFRDRELRTSIELALCRQGASRVVQDLEHRFFDISIDMVCFLDFNGYFKWLNPAWERTLGFTREELMSKPFIEFVHPDDRERTLTQNREVRGGGQARSFENRYLHKDGSFRWFRWNAAPDTSAQVIYSVARDVTENKQADEERERLVRELQSALAEVKTLRGILPICSYCRKIRDDANYWHTVESYISRNTSTRFSHSICPTCMETEVEPQLRAFERG